MAFPLYFPLSNVTGRQRVAAFKVHGIPNPTAPDKSNVIRGIQRGSACKVDGIPTRTAPDKSNVIRGIQRGSACKVDGIPTHTVPGKSNVTGRQRVVASKQNPEALPHPFPVNLMLPFDAFRVTFRHPDAWPCRLLWQYR